METTMINAFHSMPAEHCNAVTQPKFEEIMSLIAGWGYDITPQVAADYIAADWDDPKHIEWLQHTPANEIADWIVAGQ